MFKFIITFFSILLFASCGPKKQEADLILHHAVIYSVDSSFRTYEAMAVKDGKIIELNSNDEILKKYNPFKVYDANGKYVFPGFIDAHCHFLSYGLGLEQILLEGTKSYKEVIEKVKQFSKTFIPSTEEEENWIIGRGWDQNTWEKKEFPTRKELDSLFPNTPVILKRIDGHAALVNSKALEEADITLNSKINGGEFIKDKNGLTGVLIDNAVDLVEKVIPPPTVTQIKKALLAAQEKCFELGLTTIDEAGIMKSDIDRIDDLQKTNQLKIRIYAMLSDNPINFKHFLEKGVYKTERLNVRSFKFYADGALGSRGACLLQNYSDKPEWKGFLLNTKEHFEKYAGILIQSGFQMNTHCIGDSATRLILAIYNTAFKTVRLVENQMPTKYKPRWRIEHFQVTTPLDLKLYLNKNKDVIPSVQPTHATSDMYWAEQRLGPERLKFAYAYKELLKATGIVALGTDFPVEDISPFKTFYAAVYRKNDKGLPKSGFQPENALTREETLKGMTIWAAYSNFEENEKGSLEKGKFADFIILDNDLMKCEENKILQTKVLATFVNGEKVYGQ